MKKGTKVTVHVHGQGDHGYDVGTVVTCTGVKWHVGTWMQFTTEDGYTQYMQPQHYKVLKEVKEDLPAKALYVILNKNNKILDSDFDREAARAVKARFGGKRNGVRIVTYVPQKEIR